MAGIPEFKQIKRLVFRVETSGRIKELTGFQKSYAVPEAASASARKFVARIAESDIQADLDQTVQSLRDAFQFKRKQMETILEEGTGAIRTPRFTYTISLDMDPADPTRVLWRREVSAVKDPQMIRSPEFLAVFGNLFNSLVFEFSKPLGVAAMIDRFEEEDRPGVTLSYASDASWCEITLTGFHGAIRVEPLQLTISGRHSPTTASLLDQFLAFVDHWPRKRGWPGAK